jgi:serine/threonine protein kinase
MKLDEIARTRVFLKTVFVLTAGGIIVALSTGGDPVAEVVVLVGSIAASLGSLVLLVVTRDPDRYDPRKLVLPALPIVFGVTLDAMSKLEQAVRGNAHRDALLAEARAELDRALKIGGPGRWTEQEIGSFQLGVLIGRGGMGEVYEAYGLTDRREAAVKLLHPGTLAEPVLLQRFLREAHTASQLDCPHIVRVLEVGTTAGEIPFLAMERLRGHDLAHQLRRQRRLPLPQIKILVDQVAIGLEAARVAGIVHRDLKPHNVFFAEEAGLRRWKILDFGVSKSGGSGTSRRATWSVHRRTWHPSKRAGQTSTTAPTSTRSPPSSFARSPAIRCSRARTCPRPSMRSSTACRPGPRCSPSSRVTSIASLPLASPKTPRTGSLSPSSSRAGSAPPSPRGSIPTSGAAQTS